MNKIILLITALISICSCTDTYRGVDAVLVQKLEQRLTGVDSSRSGDILNAISKSPIEEREGMVFLFANMPQADLDTLSIELIENNVKYSYMARAKYKWAEELPLDIFYNDVLPYASMDETREDWRESFYAMFAEVVDGSSDAFVAVDTLNKAIKELLQVEYNTKRRKPNQSPSESIEIGMASCSGLSILLTDALRSVGIPSRIAGTPLWVTKEGNHNWSEVWIDGDWYFLEYYPEKLNHGWFLVRCAAFEGYTAPQHQVYATSFSDVESIHFPMVWSRDDKTIHGLNVTQRYIDIFKEQQALANAPKENEAALTIKVIKQGGDLKVSGDRVAVDVVVYDADGNNIASGKSRGANADMNDYLVVNIPKNQKIKVVASGVTKHLTATDDDKLELVIYQK